MEKDLIEIFENHYEKGCERLYEKLVEFLTIKLTEAEVKKTPPDTILIQIIGAENILTSKKPQAK